MPAERCIEASVSGELTDLRKYYNFLNSRKEQLITDALLFALCRYYCYRLKGLGAVLRSGSVGPVCFCLLGLLGPDPDPSVIKQK